MSTYTFTDQELHSGKNLQHFASVLKACKYLQRCASQLQAPHSLVEQMKVLLNRFYCFHSTTQYEYHEISAAVLFLGCKLGQGRDFKQLDQVAKVCAQEAKKSKDVESRELQRWKAVILAHEFQILLTLNFDTIVELPHTFALQLLGEFNASEQTKHLAFLYCNDATMTSLVVRYSPKFIAYACVYLATLGTGDQLQHGDKDWISKKGLKLRKLKAVAQEVSLVQDDVRMSRLSGRRERMIKYRLSQPSRVPDHVQDTSPPYATTHSPSPRFLQGIVPTTKS